MGRGGNTFFVLTFIKECYLWLTLTWFSVSVVHCTVNCFVWTSFTCKVTMYVSDRSKCIHVSRSNLWWWSFLELSTRTLCPSATVHARYSWVLNATLFIKRIRCYQRCFLLNNTSQSSSLLYMLQDIDSERPMMQVGQYVFAGEYEGKNECIIISRFIY